MDDQTNQSEPGSAETLETGANQFPPLLTVSQAYGYLIAEGLPRSKKTIRKWCRLNHVEKKENVVLGGSKWLITKSSLDARIAEERLIDASLTQETSPNRSEPVSPRTGTNPYERVRDDELVDVLKEQLTHERGSRKAAEEKNQTLLTMYHEISIASTRVGIEIGKGMQEQGRARQLGTSGGAPDSHGSPEFDSSGRIIETNIPETPHTPEVENQTDEDQTGDNPVSENHE